MNNIMVRPTFAKIESRLIALLVDGVVLGVITGIIYGLLGDPAPQGILTFLFTVAYQWYFLVNHHGQTPGKMLLGIRVVKTDGSPLTGFDAVLRVLGYTLNWMILGIGWLLAFYSPERQGLHDMIAQTYVVQK